MMIAVSPPMLAQKRWKSSRYNCQTTDETKSAKATPNVSSVNAREYHPLPDWKMSEGKIQRVESSSRA